MSDSFVEVVKYVLVFLGGTTVKALVDHFNKSSEVAQSDSIKQRQELREDVQTLKGDVLRLTQELDRWQEKYYKATSEISQLKFEHGACLAKTEALEARIAELEKKSRGS